MQAQVQIPESVRQAARRASSIDLPAEIMIDDQKLSAYRDELAKLPSVNPVRLAYAAAHVVMHDEYASCPHSLAAPGPPEQIAEFIDWDATLAIRRRLDDLGFGIAEAMDTAQRFFIGWENAARLIKSCGQLNPTNGFIAAAAADTRPPRTKIDLIDMVIDQAASIQNAGGQVIILPLPWLPQNHAGKSDYLEVYTAIIRAVSGPLYIHWLGEQFMPILRGYFPDDSFEQIMSFDAAKVRGVKISLLDPLREYEIRQQLLARDQIVLTGDDFNFARLIRGGDPRLAGSSVAPVGRWLSDGPSASTSGKSARSGDSSPADSEFAIPLGDFSHALLGILDAIAVPAAYALKYLAHDRLDRYLDLMIPCERLSTAIFEPPTAHYKAGLAFLSWLNRQQSNAYLVNHEQRARSLPHYLHIAQLAADAGIFANAPLAAARLQLMITNEVRS